MCSGEQTSPGQGAGALTVAWPRPHLGLGWCTGPWAGQDRRSPQAGMGTVSPMEAHCPLAPSHMGSVTHALCQGETQHPEKPGGLPTAAQPGSSRARMWVEVCPLERRQETSPRSLVWPGPQWAQAGGRASKAAGGGLGRAWRHLPGWQAMRRSWMQCHARPRAPGSVSGCRRSQSSWCTGALGVRALQRQPGSGQDSGQCAGGSPSSRAPRSLAHLRPRLAGRCIRTQLNQALPGEKCILREHTWLPEVWETLIP